MGVRKLTTLHSEKKSIINSSPGNDNSTIVSQPSHILGKPHDIHLNSKGPLRRIIVLIASGSRRNGYS